MIRLEVCVDDAAGLDAAIAGGADRIELCSALALGGLTPSAGLMAIAAKAVVPVYAMIRPRSGDFVFTPREIEQMRAEIDAVRSAGLAGVVLGASRPDGMLDGAVLQVLAQHAKGLGLSLHRAFDCVADERLTEAIDLAVALGFERILTAGGAMSASDGIEPLKRCFDLAQGRIIIMPGGGVTPATAAALLAALPIEEIHGSCSALADRKIRAAPTRYAAAQAADNAGRQTDVETVKALKRALSVQA